MNKSRAKTSNYIFSISKNIPKCTFSLLIFHKLSFPFFPTPFRSQKKQHACLRVNLNRFLNLCNHVKYVKNMKVLKHVIFWQFGGHFLIVMKSIWTYYKKICHNCQKLTDPCNIFMANDESCQCSQYTFYSMSWCSQASTQFTGCRSREITLCTFCTFPKIMFSWIIDYFLNDHMFFCTRSININHSL